jgi:hypothetical protein
MTPRPLIPLGFAPDSVPAGSHICQVFSTDEERDQLLCSYVTAGLQNHERCACFTDHLPGTAQSAWAAASADGNGSGEPGAALLLRGTAEAYFAEGRFDPERMLASVEAFHAGAMATGYRAARVIGEMSQEVEKLPGGSRLLEYEAKVSLMLREHPVTAMCQYDARDFDGGSIMEILRVHPLLVVRGFVVRNPFYVPAERFLAGGA